MTNAFTCTGTYDAKSLCVQGDKWAVDLAYSPQIIARIEQLYDGQHVTVTGSIFSLELERTAPVMLYVQQIERLALEKDAPPSGRLIAKATEWEGDFSFWEELTLWLEDQDGRDVCVQMPAVHTRCAQTTRGRHLVGRWLILDCTYKQEVVECSRVTVTDSPQVFQLPATKGSMEYEAQSGERKNAKPPRRARSISAALRRDVFMRDGFRCCECGASPAERLGVYLEVDHVIPFSRGGTNEMGNLQTLCSICNAGKADGMPVNAAGLRAVA